MITTNKLETSKSKTFRVKEKKGLKNSKSQRKRNPNLENI